MEVDDKAMKKTHGTLRKMVSLIHHKTDEPRAEIRKKIVAVM